MEEDASLPGVCSTEVRESGLPGSGGLQQVEAGVDVGSNPLRQHLRVLRGHRRQVQGASGRVCLPGPEARRHGESKCDPSIAQQVKAQMPVKPGMFLRGPEAQAVALEVVAVNFRVLGQGLDDSGVAQASLPQLLVSQQPAQQLLLGGVHLDGAAPHPQRAAVGHLHRNGEPESELSGANSQLHVLRRRVALPASALLSGLRQEMLGAPLQLAPPLPLLLLSAALTGGHRAASFLP
ncbi:hypothetical protein FQN60_000330 [Etheostoma spectabile]|uniref:Uncharacterized protein n=1 Tax=Etheostoma spectabile TaxID=54343 RepID=A0A5J5CZE8_9PERO|nr:hypothetical protein FQN60_000330 [Etheostoma spectabile]